MEMGRLRELVPVVAVGIVLSYLFLRLPVPFEARSGNQDLNFNGAHVIVVRSEEEWARLHSRSEPWARASKASAGIDFNESELVAVSFGGRPSGGYSLQVEDVVRTGPLSRAIEVVERVPGPEMPRTLAITHPMAIVTVPRSFAMYGVIRRVEVVHSD